MHHKSLWKGWHYSWRNSWTLWFEDSHSKALWESVSTKRSYITSRMDKRSKSLYWFRRINTIVSLVSWGCWAFLSPNSYSTDATPHICRDPPVSASCALAQMASPMTQRCRCVSCFARPRAPIAGSSSRRFAPSMTPRRFDFYRAYYKAYQIN